MCIPNISDGLIQTSFQHTKTVPLPTGSCTSTLVAPPLSEVYLYFQLEVPSLGNSKGMGEEGEDVNILPSPRKTSLSLKRKKVKEI